MNINDLPEPICHKCLNPVYNEPLYDNAELGLCPKCFEVFADLTNNKSMEKNSDREIPNHYQ